MDWIRPDTAPAPGNGFLALALGICVWTFAGCGDAPVEKQMNGAPHGVDVVELQPETVTLRRAWIGTLKPLKTAVISAPESGDVIEVLVKDGDRVARNDLLVRMDGPELTARRAVLIQRQASREAELARWERLASADAAGPSEVEAARLRLLEVEEALAEVEARLSSSELRAPVSGRVSDLNTAPGARVAAGNPLLRVDDEDSLGMRLFIPARERRYLDDSERLRLRGETEGEIPVRRIVAAEDATAPRGFLSVEVWVDGGEVPWPSEATLTYSEEREAVVAPWTAVARENGQNWVAVVAGDPLRIERRAVVLGSGQSHGIEVVEGLEPGDRVMRFEPRSQPEGRLVAIRERTP